MALEFQIYDFIEDHDEVPPDSDGEQKGVGNYIIHTFGINFYVSIYCYCI